MNNGFIIGQLIVILAIFPFASIYHAVFGVKTKRQLSIQKTLLYFQISLLVIGCLIMLYFWQ